MPAPDDFDVTFRLPSKQSSQGGAPDDITCRVLGRHLQDRNDFVTLCRAMTAAVSMGRLQVDSAWGRLRMYTSLAERSREDEAEDVEQHLDACFLASRQKAMPHPGLSPGRDRYVTVAQHVMFMCLRLYPCICRPVLLKLYGKSFASNPNEIHGYVRRKRDGSGNRVEGGKIHLPFDLLASKPRDEHTLWRDTARTFVHEATHKHLYTADGFYIDEIRGDRGVYSTDSGVAARKALNNADSFAWFASTCSVGRLEVEQWAPATRLNGLFDALSAALAQTLQDGYYVGVERTVNGHTFAIGW